MTVGILARGSEIDRPDRRDALGALAGRPATERVSWDTCADRYLAPCENIAW